jgi:mycofactocin precursor
MADPTAPETTDAAADEPVLVEADLLVEDVSIDGMCGVY